MFKRSIRVPTIDWGQLILAVNERFPILNDPEELVEAMIDVGFELLPAPIRIVIGREI